MKLVTGARSCALMMTLIAAPAWAQEAPADETWTPEKVVVTGRRGTGYDAKTATVSRSGVPIKETPQSIQVLTPTLIEEQNLTTLADAVVNVSGVVPAQPSEAVLVNPIVRGFESEIFIDGLIGYGDTAVIDPSSLAVVERIEVAKGPTSTLFGGGAGAPVGGLINLVTKSPKDKAAYSATLRGGSFDTFAGTFDVNQPVGEGAAFRFAGEYLDGGDAIDAVDITRLTLNPSARVQIGDATSLEVRGLYNKVEQLEYAGLPAIFMNDPSVDPFRFTSAKNAPKTEIENATVTGVLTHSFSEAVTGQLQVRRYESSFDEIASFPFLSFFPCLGTSCAIIKGRLPIDIGETTVDASLKAEFETGSVKHVMLGGVQYDKTDYIGAIGFDFGPIGILDHANPASDVPYGALPALTSFYDNDYGTTAAYIQDQVTIGERLHILASLRYSALSLTEKLTGIGTDKTWHRLDPRIGAVYDLDDNVSVFAGYATGSRLSLFFSGTSAPVPETSDSYEAGLKLGFADLGLSGTVAVYQLTRQNVPTPDPIIPFASVQTGEQRSRGVEADLIWEPSANWSFLGTFAYTDAEVTKDNAIPVGDGLTRVPPLSGRLAGRYRFTDGDLKGLGLGLGVTAASKAELTIPNTLKSDAYAVVDAQASYEIGKFEVGISVVNLTDARYFTPYQYLGQAVVRPGTPQSATVSVGFKF